MIWPWAVALAVLWVVVIALAALVLGMMRRIAPVLAEAENVLRSGGNDFMPGIGGLPVGAEVPEFELLEGGRTFRFGEGGSLPLPAVVLFVENGCPPCEELTAALERKAEFFEGARLYIIPEIAPGEQEKFEALKARDFRVFEQSGRQASEAFRQQVFPQAFGVDGERRVVDVVASGKIERLERLIQETRAYDDLGGEVRDGKVQHQST